MSRRNLPLDGNGRVQDTFDPTSLKGKPSTVGVLGIRTINDVFLDFVKRLLSFAPALG